MIECMFSADQADSAEHVIPKWLQSRYNLWNQRVVLPNNTSLPYRQLTVPVASEHNVAFSAIENRISSGTCSPMDVYLWALKIHIGFIYKDSSLRFRREEPSSPMILKAGDFAQEVFIFRMLYRAWHAEGTITPSPFGSVYLLKSHYVGNDFDLFHCLVTGAIGITIPGMFILVLFWDQGDSRRDNSIKKWPEHEARILGSSTRSRASIPYMAYHVWSCETAYEAFRQRRPHTLMITPSSVVSMSASDKTERKPFNLREYAAVCRSSGLKLEGRSSEERFLYSQRRLR